MSGLVKTFDFNGAAITAYVFRGRECWIAQDVARVLGYDPKGWSNSLRGWEGELIDGQDYLVLRGVNLREFVGTTGYVVAKTTQLSVLFEPGLNLVCIKTEKPLGKTLRRFVAERVLPDLRRRSADVGQIHQELIALSLRLAAVDQPTIWERDVVVTLCRLYRKKWDGKGSMPMWLKQPFGRIYKIVLGDHVYKEMKRRNPRPSNGSLHYQYLTEPRHRLMSGLDMARVTSVLGYSTTAPQFFRLLSAEFGRGPRQLEMGS